MTRIATRERNGGVLAVLVLYERPLEAAVAWPTLLAMLGQPGALSLRHCLVFDNSPDPLAPIEALPAEASISATRVNRGTAGAYAAALERAESEDCDWMLRLDQDTSLPSDYLLRAALAREATPAAVALTPRIRDCGRLVSPAVITPTGSVQPVVDPRCAFGQPTAISSGLVVARDAVRAAQPFPEPIWLDYVDHWIFLIIAREDAGIGLINADLSHDLSVRNPGTLSVPRLESILAAESAFYEALSATARRWLPVRRLARACRYVALGQFALAGTIVRHLSSRPTSR